NVVVLSNGGTLHLLMNARNQDALFGQLGNPLAGGIRQIQVGTGGGVINVSTGVDALRERFILSGVNPITGSGTLTKTGQGYLEILTSTDFSGQLVIASQGGGVELRASGALPNVQSITVGQNGYFIVDNQNGRSNRQWPSVNNNNRVNDSASISLQGGFLYYRPRNASGQTQETFGTVTISQGHGMIRLEPQGQGADVTISNLVRTTADAGGGTVRLETTTGTFGSTGNNPRLFFTQINGTAPTTTNLTGGWAFLRNAYGSPNPSYHWAAYDTTAGVGVKPSTYTNIGAVNFTPNSTNIVNLNASGTATLEDSSTNKHEMLALRFGADADQTLTFADLTNDVLYIGSGGILAENYNRSRYIGTSGSGTRGTITAGPSSGATGTQELFFHIPQGTTYVYSTITDNGSAPVALVKDLGGTVQLEATNNTYSGGTYLYGGRINATKPGSLGTGPVLVKGGALQLNAAGATSSTAGIRVIDGSELYLASNIAYNQTGDRFYIEAGSTITAYHTSSTAGFASLTRVYTWPATADGQVYLEPGAIVRIPSGSILHGDIM
ncbi:MAG TPA: hypothetical protein PLQ00_14715, partial [Thermoguttaceae bacterium]|nr:hypothetical protein [Thermoguttaceae bacterium]